MGNPRLRLIAYTAGNFLSSLSGGFVLAAYLKPLRFDSGFAVDSVFGYLLGSVIALAAATLMRGQLSALGRYLSVVYAGAVVLILSIGSAPAIGPLFLLLCFVFAVGSLLRGMRTDSAARVSTIGVAAAEAGYSAGYLAGLGLSSHAAPTSTLAMWSVTTVVVVQCVLDLWQGSSAAGADASSSATSAKAVRLRERLPPLSPFLSLLGLLVAVQLVTQRLAARDATTLPLFAFELGVALAPLFVMVGQVTGDITSLAPREWTWIFGSRRFSLRSALAIVLLLQVAGKLAILYPSPIARGVGALALCAAAFGFELVCLLLLQGIGTKPGSVLLTLAATGATLSVTYALLLHAPVGALRETWFALAAGIVLCLAGQVSRVRPIVAR